MSSSPNAGSGSIRAQALILYPPRGSRLAERMTSAQSRRAAGAARPCRDPSRLQSESTGVWGGRGGGFPYPRRDWTRKPETSLSAVREGGVPHRDCRIFGIANSPGTLDEATWYPMPGHGLPGSQGRRGRGRGEGRDGGRDGAEPCEGAMGRLGEGREAARPREWSLSRAKGDSGRGGACALARGSKGAGARWGEEPRHGGRSPAPLPRPPGRASARPGGCQPATQQPAAAAVPVCCRGCAARPLCLSHWRGAVAHGPVRPGTPPPAVRRRAHALRLRR